MARFVISRDTGRITVVFDDGGMNLLSTGALRELQSILGQVREAGASDHLTSPRPAILVFRSGRPALFAAGADMTEMRRFTPEHAWNFAHLGQAVFDAIERLPLLTIAVIDGDCFGGALDLALAFDLRVATPRSRFAHPGARLGLVTGFGGTSRWRKVVERPVANQLFLANRVLDASEAARLGLVDAVVPEPEAVLERWAGADATRVRLVNILAGAAIAPGRERLLRGSGMLSAEC